MSKTLSTYLTYTPTQLKTRASVPLQQDISIGTTTIDCSNVNDALIKNVLGSGTTSVVGLSSDPNVNKWSYFNPTRWYIETDTYINTPKIPYTLSNFAGYNHHAIIPYTLFPYPFNKLGSETANTVVHIGCFLNFGEYDWTSLNTKCFVLCEGATVASFPTSSIVPDTEMNIVLDLTAPAIGITKLYTIEVWIGSTNVWQGKVTQFTSSVQIKVGVPAMLTACTAIDSLANRTKATTKLGLGGGETVGLVWASGSGLGVSTGGLFSGTFNVFADISNSTTGAYLRTETLCTTALMRSTLYTYKINEGVRSPTYTVATLVRLLPDQGLTYDIPLELMPLADGDNYYLFFDNFI